MTQPNDCEKMTAIVAHLNVKIMKYVLKTIISNVGGANLNWHLHVGYQSFSLPTVQVSKLMLVLEVKSSSTKPKLDLMITYSLCPIMQPRVVPLLPFQEYHILRLPAIYHLNTFSSTSYISIHTK